MKTKIDELLLLLQQGLPLVQYPFQVIGAKVGLSEKEVIEIITELFETGKARRLGAIFDSRRMGYKSMLCGAHIDPDVLDDVVGEMNHDTGITHGYLRGWSEQLDINLPGAPLGLEFPNYWFTYMADVDNFDSSINKIEKTISPAKVLQLPALKRFKIDVIFDPRKNKGELFDKNKRAIQTSDVHCPKFSDSEKEIIRRLQGNIELCHNPFDSTAKAVGLTVENLLKLLKKWHGEGILRRFPLILRHHQIGFKANGMCLWKVAEDKISDIGQKLASCREITHCYQRPEFAGFEYNLYAMIHGTFWQETYDMFEKIQNEVGLTDGKMLCSLKEYKKSSPVYFMEESYE